MSPAPTILVVEDNPATRKMFGITLERAGFTVVEAGDGRSAIEAVERRLPDLVLQDFILPDMDGLYLVRRLREIPGAQEIPILALSGFLSRLEEARTAEAGFTTLLVKPIEPSRLVEAVRAYLPAQPEAPPRTPRGLRLLLVDDDPVQLKLARLHFAQMGYETVTAASAAEALLAARRQVPDVILSGVLMPDVDGYDLCLELRRDPVLARVPVVLVSGQYGTEADRSLAQHVGAHALVLRTPDFANASEALEEAIRSGAPPVDGEPSEEVRLEHYRALVHQLGRQVTIGAGLAQRCTFLTAQLSLLSGMAGALANQEDADLALREVLAATLDAAGISVGALFLKDPDGTLRLRHGVGFSRTEWPSVDGFFEHRALLEEIVERGAAVSVPSADVQEDAGQEILSRADVAALQIVPLISKGRSAGAIVLGAKRTDISSEDSVAFARAVGNQMVQSLELAEVFERLTASELRYRTLLENANDAIAVIGPDSRVRHMNQRWATITGRPKEDLVGLHVRDFVVSGRERDTVETYDQSVAEGSGRTMPVAIQHHDGTTVLMVFSNSVIEVGGEELVMSVGRDVTEEVKARERLMVADRMASVGTLAAGVAHEINSPLTAVTANLEVAVRDLTAMARPGAAPPDLAKLESEIRDAREAAEQVRMIVRDLKVFSRVEEQPPGPVDVHHVLDSSLRMAWNEIQHRAQLVKDYGDVPLVLGTESRLGQVFLNLFVNAAQAIPEGRAQANEVRVRTRAMAAPDRVVVEVADSGLGMPPDVARNVFSPFFTTKQIGEGTGLGLAICHRIVTSLDGEITFDTEPGKGTVFRVVLPAAGDREVTARSEPAAGGRGRTILIVDDERMVGVAIGRLLEVEHHVTIVTSGTEALERIAAGERFDSILCDLMMPTMSGMDLHAELLQAAPDQAERMIFMTGGAFTPRARAFLDEVPNPGLEKPLELQTLRALVSERSPLP